MALGLHDLAYSSACVSQPILAELNDGPALDLAFVSTINSLHAITMN